MREDNNAFKGTIYEQYDLPSPSTHMIVVHVNPSVEDSAVFADGKLSFEQISKLSDSAAQVFRDSFAGIASFHTLPVEGFLIFALGLTIPEELGGEQYSALLDAVRTALELALVNISSSLGLTLYLSVSSPHANTQNVYDAYHEAFSIALHFPFLEHKDWILTADEFQDGLPEGSILVKNKLERQWFSSLESRNFVESESVLFQIVELRASSAATVKSLKQELISRMTYATYLFCDAEDLFPQVQESLLRLVDQIRGAKTMQDIQLVLHDLYTAMDGANGTNPMRVGRDWSRKISSFVRANYADPSLNTEMISNRFGLNPAYISFIFHEGSGIKLLDYIHNTRIEHVKRLLINSQMSLQEIACKTGYYDRHAMSRVFRRYVGMSPSEYRRK